MIYVIDVLTLISICLGYLVYYYKKEYKTYYEDWKWYKDKCDYLSTQNIRLNEELARKSVKIGNLERGMSLGLQRLDSCRDSIELLGARLKRLKSKLNEKHAPENYYKNLDC